MSLQKYNENMNERNLVFYFQVHQPKRLKVKRFFDIGADNGIFNDYLNVEVMDRVATSCYLPTNDLLLKLIKKNPNIKITFSISGVTIEQFELYAPEVLESFKSLAETGSVEFLGETYYHSLACKMQGHEFEIQALKHAELIEKHFGKRPTVFRNTELIYNDEIGQRISRLGFNGVFTDGVKQVVKNNKSVNQVYQHPEVEDLKILLRNYVLSDDIAFRFSQPGNHLTAENYAQWLREIPSFEKVVNIAMDYETFGEHQKKESGILEFAQKLFTILGDSKEFKMMTASEAVALESAGKLFVSDFVSWADQERDLSAWLGNDMQRDAFSSITKLERKVKDLGDPEILKTWRQLLTSDHFYYMSTKKGSDGSVHDYFSPYPSPYEAFINYMNVLTDFTVQLDMKKSARKTLRQPKVKTRQQLEDITIIA